MQLFIDFYLCVWVCVYLCGYVYICGSVCYVCAGV